MKKTSIGKKQSFWRITNIRTQFAILIIFFHFVLVTFNIQFLSNALINLQIITVLSCTLVINIELSKELGGVRKLGTFFILFGIFLLRLTTYVSLVFPTQGYDLFFFNEFILRGSVFSWILFFEFFHQVLFLSIWEQKKLSSNKKRAYYFELFFLSIALWIVLFFLRAVTPRNLAKEFTLTSQNNIQYESVFFDVGGSSGMDCSVFVVRPVFFLFMTRYRIDQNYNQFALNNWELLMSNCWRGHA